MTDTTRDSGLDTARLFRSPSTRPADPRRRWLPRRRARRRGRSVRDAWGELRASADVLDLVGLDRALRRDGGVPAAVHQHGPDFADLSKAREAPSADAWFGCDSQGYDVYARTVYGARASIIVGIFATLFVALRLVRRHHRRLPRRLARLGDRANCRDLPRHPVTARRDLVPLHLPQRPADTPFSGAGGKVALVIGVLAWPTITRLMRSSVLQVKPNDYVQAARALGASPDRIIRSHILPNSLASVIVVSTINLGVFISVEATLSFLGVGLQPPVISWGNMISDASGIGLIRAAPHMLLFPSLFLSLTVLAFIMLGDVVRDALDPRLR